jgi:hypothetical protein
MVLTYWFHDYDDEKNNGLWFYHNFDHTNVKFIEITIQGHLNSISF